MSAVKVPTLIHYEHKSRVLTVTFDDGASFALHAEYLRVESPSAEVQGHGTRPKLPVAGKRNVSVERIEPVGNYAVRLVFDDGHDTGLYTWSYLHELGQEQPRRWFEYEARLRTACLSRDG